MLLLLEQLDTVIDSESETDTWNNMNNPFCALTLGSFYSVCSPLCFHPENQDNTQ